MDRERKQGFQQSIRTHAAIVKTTAALVGSVLFEFLRKRLQANEFLTTGRKRNSNRALGDDAHSEVHSIASKAVNDIPANLGSADRDRQSSSPKAAFCGGNSKISLPKLIRRASIRTSWALSRPGAHLGFQYQVGAATFLSASNARKKTRNHRHTVSFYEFLYEFLPVRNLIIKCRSWPLGVNRS